LLLAAGALSLSGQRVFVVSEFQRLRPDGLVVEADRAEKRREILSPAVVRNAHATYRVAVEVPAGMPYTIYIGQNPDESVEVTMYQEEYEKAGEEWVPDRLKKVEMPVNAQLPAGQRVQTYLLDLWVPGSTPMARFRLEVQLNAGDRWVIYPMEFRPRPASGDKAEPRGTLPAVERRADSAARGPVEEFLCGAKPAAAEMGLTTARAIVNRNVREDLVLARQRAKEEPPDGIAGMLLMAGGWTSKAEFCSGDKPAPRGPEWWLRARDYLYQGLPVH
jgi:hypothetical protein